MLFSAEDSKPVGICSSPILCLKRWLRSLSWVDRSLWGCPVPYTRTLSWAGTSGGGCRKHSEGDQLAFRLSGLQEAWCGRSRLVPSAGDSRGRGRGILGLGSQFPGSRRKENARREDASPGQSWVWADISGGQGQELQMSGNGAKPSGGLTPDLGSSGRKEPQFPLL